MAFDRRATNVLQGFNQTDI